MASGGVSSSSSRPQATPQQIIDLYNRSLPSVMGTTFGQVPGATQTLAQSAAGSNPIYTASGLQQLQQFAPGYAQVGTDLQKQQAQASTDILKAQGTDIATTGNALMKLVNPEYFNLRSNLANQTGNYLNSFNGGKLNPGELAAVERSVNQSNTATGNLGNNSATNTVANAMNFGQAARDKQAAYGNALVGANSILPNLNNTQFNPVNATMNLGNTSGNFALQQYDPTQANATTQLPLQWTSGLMSNLAGLGGAQNSSSSSVNASVGNCCFIFLEAYNGKLPWFVRLCRDHAYVRQPDVAKGYVKMARWLVPVMRRSKIVSWLINKLMVTPLTKYGGYCADVAEYTNYKKYRIVERIWFKIWKSYAML